MSEFFRRHYPFAATTMVVTPLLAGDIALWILAMAAAIALVPCAYAPDVDEIARRVTDPDQR